jgi:hypothetical protein
MKSVGLLHGATIISARECLSNSSICVRIDYRLNNAISASDTHESSHKEHCTVKVKFHFLHRSAATVIPKVVEPQIGREHYRKRSETHCASQAKDVIKNGN